MSDSLSGPSYAFGPAGPDTRDGQFHHVAVTVQRDSATGGKLYVDGQEVLTFDPTVAAGDLSNTEPLRIGVNANATFFSNFKGAIDEVSLYHRALTAAEVRSIYSAGSAGKCGILVRPIITSQPASQAASVGDTVAFSVTAAGDAPLSYQWRWNGLGLAGQTASSLTLNDVQLTNAGSYSVVVTNPAGSVISSNAGTDGNRSVGLCVGAFGFGGLVERGRKRQRFSGNKWRCMVNGVGFTNGEVGQAFALDGVDDAVIVSNVPAVNFGAGQDFSIEAWVKPLPSKHSVRGDDDCGQAAFALLDPGCGL